MGTSHNTQTSCTKGGASAWPTNTQAVSDAFQSGHFTSFSLPDFLAVFYHSLPAPLPLFFYQKQIHTHKEICAPLCFKWFNSELHSNLAFIFLR